jgi:hypothetical protein
MCIYVQHIVGSIFGPVRFLLPVCRLSWFLYTLNIYAHFSSHFSQQLLMAEIWYLVTSFFHYSIARVHTDVQCQYMQYMLGYHHCILMFVCWKYCYKHNKMNCELMLTYDTPALRQTGSRNLMCPKMLPTIWGTYMKLVTSISYLSF